jgi:hypothetical protein
VTKPPRQAAFSDGGVAGSSIVFLPKLAAMLVHLFD